MYTDGTGKMGLVTACVGKADVVASVNELIMGQGKCHVVVPWLLISSAAP